MGKLPFEKTKREVLVRKEADTNPGTGEIPEKRTVERLIDFGVINIDKPKGPTSHQVSEFVQKILGLKKAGHSGSLDPAVTGVLPVALGSATRIVQTLLPSGKEYVCIMHLHQEIDEKTIRKVMKSFVGKIMQKPPIKSAVKRVEREREIYYIEILEIDGKDILFVVGCEAGTYIRKLCHDMGKTFGVGAHMAELRRTKAGPFNEETLVTLQDLTDAYHYWKEEGKDSYIRKFIFPVEFAVAHMPKVWVFDNAIDSLCHGSALKVPGISKLDSGIEPGQAAAMMTLKNELIGIGTAKLDSEKMLQEEKGVAVKTHKVFMKPGVYSFS
jgi:H/ACA ribonucleoprotein complex subunit 4